MTPEDRLLSLAALHNAASNHANELQDLIRGAINWDTIHQKAAKHRIGCQVFQTLSIVAFDRVPELYRRHWQETAERSVRHNLTLVGELIRVIDLLDRHGILCLSFKGPVLAALLHGTVALRPFADLDLIVATPEEARIAKELIVAEGYRVHESLTPRQEQLLLQTHCEYHLLHPEKQIYIDLHWNVFYDYFSYSFDLPRAFRESITVPVAHRALRSFRPEDLLLLLSAHHARHAWETMLMIVDIADLLQTHPDLDWQYIENQAERVGGRRLLHLALFLAERVCTSHLPSYISSQARSDITVRRLAQLVQCRWFSSESGTAGMLDELLFHLRCRERLFHQLRFLLRGLFTPGPHDFA
ncbi:MAG TPA: nucleotidyltransferase family protein, partial [Candidatus Ozemobacteraceae bacterium]|nr:nucleotidyltransferase family protein [Candidatus Ozemobacteraceae bacterium]